MSKIRVVCLLYLWKAKCFNTWDGKPSGKTAEPMKMPVSGSVMTSYGGKIECFPIHCLFFKESRHEVCCKALCSNNRHSL